MRKGKIKSGVNGVPRRKKRVAEEEEEEEERRLPYNMIQLDHDYLDGLYSDDEYETQSLAELSIADKGNGAQILGDAQGKENHSEAGGPVVQNGQTEFVKGSRSSGRPSQRVSKSHNVAVVNMTIDPKVTLFFDSIREGSLQKVRAMVRGRNMNMNTRDLNDPLAPTALLVACEIDNAEIIKILMTTKKARFLDVNQENKQGRRPIWVAALKGNHEIADLLMNTRGTECDVNFIDKETGTSPLYRAILSNSPECVRLLIAAKADVNMRKMGKKGDMTAETPLIKAVQMDNLEIATQLVNGLCKMQAKTEDGFSALHYAVAYKRYEISEFLLKNEIRIHSKSNHGITAMTVAIEHHNPAMVKLLIEYGYKMDKRYSWKETPLSQAINLHSEECAMTLIHQGCSLQKKRGNSYFYMAVDEKMMRLTKFMAAVNPHYLQEDFVRKKEWPVSIYHRPDIIEWLERESEKVRTLRQLCRGKIFRLIGKYPPHKVKSLNLPEKMREYVSYRSHVRDEFFNRDPLNLRGECPMECPAICTRKYCPPIEFSSGSESEVSIDDDDIEPTPQQNNHHHHHHHHENEEQSNCDCCP